MRRTVLVLATIAALLAWRPSLGQAPPIKLGLLFPYTGPIASVGQDATRGFELHLAKLGNRAGGREIQLLKEDESSSRTWGSPRRASSWNVTTWTSWWAR